MAERKAWSAESFYFSFGLLVGFVVGIVIGAGWLHG